MASALEFEDQAARTPAAVRGPEVAYHRLYLGADPPGMRRRRAGPVSQPAEAVLAVTGQPAVHRLASYPEPLRNLSDRSAVQNLKNGLVSLLDHVQLANYREGFTEGRPGRLYLVQVAVRVILGAIVGAATLALGQSAAFVSGLAGPAALVALGARFGRRKSRPGGKEASADAKDRPDAKPRI